MSDTTAKTPTPSVLPRRRRVLFGLNTLLAAAAAIALVVLLNWLAYRQFFRLDFTELGVYSLSPLTRQTLDDLDAEYEVVTLFATSTQSAGRRRLIDLIDEYDRRSPRLTVRHIDLDYDVDAYDDFTVRLLERYDEELRPAIAATRAAGDAVARFVRETAPARATLADLLGESSALRGEPRDFVSRAFAELRSVTQDEQRVERFVDERLAAPLPDVDGTLAELSDTLVRINQQVLPVADQLLGAVASDGSVPAETQERLLGVVETLRELRPTIRDAARLARDAEPVEAYARVRSEIARGAAVVVLGPERGDVIPEAELFIEVDPRLAERAREEVGEVETRFLGEERLTGSLVSMGLETPPMVVFVTSAQLPAVGPQGVYTHVADRLRSLNIDVRQWIASSTPTQFGQSMPPEPAPEPAMDQRAVWVVLPQPAPDPRNPLSLQGDAEARIAALLEERLAAGDGVMALLRVNPGAMVSATDPIELLVNGWGLLPRLDRLVVQERRFGEDGRATLSQFDVVDWPDDSAITRALAGTAGYFFAAAPVDAEPAEGVTSFPLLRLTADRVWSLDLLAITSPEALREAEYDTSASADGFTVAVAAERDGARLAAFTGSVWPSDQVTTFGLIPGTGMGQPGWADVFGAAYPANAELFVNTTLWLAGLDELIAASPRTQKARRVGPIDDTTQAIAITALTAGLPAASLFAGIVVYLIRRRD